MKIGHFAAMLTAVGSLVLAQPLRAEDRDDRGGDNRWPMAGANIQNTRAVPDDEFAMTQRVSGLKTKWIFTAAGDVSATPTVEGDSLYVPDWGGFIYRIDRDAGTAIWSKKVSDYTGNAKSLSRTGPAIGEHAIVFGDQAGGTVIAVNKVTGALLWKTTVDPHPLAFITGAAVISGNRVFVGIASAEEGAAANPAYKPSFRGSVAALDLRTGAVIWRFATVPAGYTGGAVWATTPAIDTERNSLYVATGNNYTVPPAVATCISAAGNDLAAKTACIDPVDYVDSVLALDLGTGALKWSRRLEGPDTWTVACILPGGFGCPVPTGPDYDFGSGPNLFHVGGDDDGGGKDIVGVGQKSGVYWAFNAANGKTVWATQVGPGGTLGGIEWGTAADGKRVYVAITNSSHVSYTLAGGATSTAGSWAALDARTGKILWQVPTPGHDAKNPAVGSLGLGAVSVAGGVMFAAATSGDLVALSTKTGTTLWSFASGVTTICGPSIVEGEVYWGTGYSHFGLGTPGNKLYAFTLP